MFRYSRSNDEEWMKPQIMKNSIMTMIGYNLSNGVTYWSEHVEKFFKSIESYRNDGKRVFLHAETFVKNHKEYLVTFLNGDRLEPYIFVEVDLDYEKFKKLEKSNERSRYVFGMINESSDYAVFTTPKASPKTFIHTLKEMWNYILQEWLPNSSYCFNENDGYVEVYDDRFYNHEEKVIEIWIPIVRR